MKWISKGNKKKYSLKRLLHSFVYAFNGIISSYKTEQNLLIETIIGIIVIGLSIYFKISKIEICVVALTIGLALALEMVNTSIEYTIDMAMPNIHPLAKIAKDVSSGAVFIFDIAAVVVGLVIFLPHIIKLF